jgi:hypothetical protein
MLYLLVRRQLCTSVQRRKRDGKDDLKKRRFFLSFDKRFRDAEEKEDKQVTLESLVSRRKNTKNKTLTCRKYCTVVSCLLSSLNAPPSLYCKVEYPCLLILLA